MEAACGVRKGQIGFASTGRYSSKRLESACSNASLFPLTAPRGWAGRASRRLDRHTALLSVECWKDRARDQRRKIRTAAAVDDQAASATRIAALSGSSTA
tara:strand:+ start:1505 stop:1804 length:300 start_codon:yes stop_codon:yes gene_type:complete